MRFIGHALIALAGVSLLALVIWRYDLRRQADDPTFDPRATHFDRGPLRVYYDQEKFPGYLGAIDSAMAMWNDRSGCEVFRRTHDRLEAQVILEPDDGTKCGAPMDDEKAPAWTDWCDAIDYIQTRRLDDGGTALRIFVHEFGHAAGLAHDRDGAMAAVVLEPQATDYPEFLRISAADAKALREHYCP